MGVSGLVLQVVLSLNLQGDAQSQLHTQVDRSPDNTQVGSLILKKKALTDEAVLHILVN